MKTQDEEQARTRVYESFVKDINTHVKEQLRRKDLVMNHLAEKTSKHPELDWNIIDQEIQDAYAQHRVQALAKMSDLIKSRESEDPYGAFIMGLGLYIVAYLVNSIENDPDAKII